MGGQHVGTQAVGAEIVPVQLRPAFTPVFGIIAWGQGIILAYSFTYQL